MSEQGDLPTVVGGRRALHSSRLPARASIAGSKKSFGVHMWVVTRSKWPNCRTTPATRPQSEPTRTGLPETVMDDQSLKLTAQEVRASFQSETDAGRFPPVLSVDQAAELLLVPKATIYDWRSRGLLNGCSRRLGKHVRFFRDRLILHVFNEGIL